MEDLQQGSRAQKHFLVESVLFQKINSGLKFDFVGLVDSIHPHFILKSFKPPYRTTDSKLFRLGGVHCTYESIKIMLLRLRFAVSSELLCLVHRRVVSPVVII